MNLACDICNANMKIGLCNRSEDGSDLYWALKRKGKQEQASYYINSNELDFLDDVFGLRDIVIYVFNKSWEEAEEITEEDIKNIPDGIKICRVCGEIYENFSCNIRKIANGQYCRNCGEFAITSAFMLKKYRRTNL